MDYLLIQNGLVVDGNKVFKADLLIGNSKILEIGKTVRRPLPGTPVIDAAGRFVMPGGIDVGAHDILRSCDDKDELQKLLSAEVTGGTTSLFEMFNASTNNAFDNELQSFIQQIGRDNFTDFALHLGYDDFSKMNVNRSKLPFAVMGINSIIVSSTNLDLLDDSSFSMLFNHLSLTGQTLLVELNIPEPVGSGYLLSKEGRNDKDEHLSRLVKMLWRLKDADFPILLSKVRFVEELEIVERFVASNKKLFSEIDSPCMLGGRNDFLHQHADNGLQNGTLGLKPISPSVFVELIGNDNFLPARPSLGLMIGNVKDSPVFNRPDKFFGLKFFSSMLYTLSVAYGSLAITDFVTCFATRPAKIMGLYPKKGVLREGSDADIVVWNPDFDRNLYCNFANEPHAREHKLQGKADFVFVNGKMVFDGEIFYRDNLAGQYLYRTPCL